MGFLDILNFILLNQNKEFVYLPEYLNIGTPMNFHIMKVHEKFIYELF